MKKNKNEIFLLVGAVIFVFIGIFFLAKSQNVNTIVEIPYEEVSSVNYKVYLNDKTYYNKDFLEEGMQYISSIIDYVDLNFNYNAEFQGVDSYQVKKIVTADVKIVDRDNPDKIIYSKNETIKEENEDLDKLNILDEIKVDYGKYNGIVNEIKTKYAISAKSMLTVSYNIIYSSEKDGLSNSKVMNVEIPLSEQMINISKPNSTRVQDIYRGNDKDTFKSVIMIILMLLMFIIAIILGIILVRKVRERISSESKYDRYIAKILREYDSYITEAKEENSLPYKDIIKVGSFKELLDVRNNIEKAIVYTKVDENTSKFQLIDEQIYEYTVTREEMDN